MAHTYFDNLTGLEIKADGPFFADLLFDYLSTTSYKWECSKWRTYFIIDDFEYSEEELLQRLSVELEQNGIIVEFYTSE